MFISRLCLLAGFVLPCVLSFSFAETSSRPGPSWAKQVFNYDGTILVLDPHTSAGAQWIAISQKTPGESVCRLFGLSGFLRRELKPFDPKRMVCSLDEQGLGKSFFDGETQVYASVTCAQVEEIDAPLK
jgi:hypothetical protein